MDMVNNMGSKVPENWKSLPIFDMKIGNESSLTLILGDVIEILRKNHMEVTIMDGWELFTDNTDQLVR